MGAAIAAAGMAVSTSLPAAEITVLNAGAVRSALAVVVADWSHETGHRVTASHGSAGELRKRLASGERADILILPKEGFEAVEREGLVAPGAKRDLGVVRIGVAVREGASVPDISTPEAFARLLRGAKSVTYMDPQRGTSGKHFDEVVLPKLGLAEAVRAKATLGEGGYIAEKVARGEVEVAIHQMTEILPVKGVTIAGFLPEALQKATVYSGAVMNGSRVPGVAGMLLEHLVSAPGRKAFLDKGFSAP